MQRDIVDTLQPMLAGAMRELCVSDPWLPNADPGPVIDSEAQQQIEAHCTSYECPGRLIYRHPLPDVVADGHFVAPTLLQLERFEQLKREILGPVLHLITFEADQLNAVIDTLNASGYGLTLGVQSRVGERIDRICERAQVGNIYVNRNQIGAVVGVQPFGGEGLSGTGPKAGGPHYLLQLSRSAGDELPAMGDLSEPREPVTTLDDPARFVRMAQESQRQWGRDLHRFEQLEKILPELPEAAAVAVAAAIVRVRALYASAGELPGPTGERNTLGLYGRGLVLCLGGGREPAAALLLQLITALAAGNTVALDATLATRRLQQLVQSLQRAGVPAAMIGWVAIDAELIRNWQELAAVVCEGDAGVVSACRHELAAREGVRVPLLSIHDGVHRFVTERVVSIDTTASGGNTTLLTLAAGRE